MSSKLRKIGKKRQREAAEETFAKVGGRSQLLKEYSQRFNEDEMKIYEKVTEDWPDHSIGGDDESSEGASEGKKKVMTEGSDTQTKGVQGPPQHPSLTAASSQTHHFFFELENRRVREQLVLKDREISELQKKLDDERENLEEERVRHGQNVRQLQTQLTTQEKSLEENLKTAFERGVSKGKQEMAQELLEREQQLHH